MSLRFKNGDRVLILPKFAHLYPGDSAVVVGARPDPFQPIFDEYKVEFPDGSSDSLFEFQLLEDDPNYKTLIATLTFDSFQQPPQQTRGQSAARQIVLHSHLLDVDLKVDIGKLPTSLLGQILQRGTTKLLDQVKVELMKESVTILKTTSDSTGVFTFKSVPRGPLNLLVSVREFSFRMLGTFSI